MARRTGSAVQISKHCVVIPFKRKRRGGALLPRSQWRMVTRCDNRKLRAHNRRQCRGRKKQFVVCPGARRRTWRSAR